MTVNIRWIEKDDLAEVAECERECHKYTDPDFGVEAIKPWAWRPMDYVKAVRQQNNQAAGTLDTRTFVAEVRTGPGIPEIVGAFCYEIQPAGYHFLKVVAHPKAGPEVLKEMLDYVLKKARRSPKRRTVSIHVPDGDFSLLKFFRENGFQAKLVPCYYEDGNDAWHCTRTYDK